MVFIYEVEPKFPPRAELEFDLRGQIQKIKNIVTIDIGDKRFSKNGLFLIISNYLF